MKTTRQAENLRFVLIYRLELDSSKIQPGSSTDLMLLRLTNTALRRANAGLADHFCFLVPRSKDSDAVHEALLGYGFPNCTTIVGGDELEDEIGDLDEHHVQDWAVFACEKWIKDHHSNAVPMLNSLPYDNGSLLWSGIVATGMYSDWPFTCEQFGQLIPSSHSQKAGTWIGILEQAMKTPPIFSSEAEAQEAACNVASLAKWLHGYEAASGNSWNDFDPSEAVDSLGIDRFFLGFNYAHLLEGLQDWETILDDVEGEFAALPAAALEKIVDSRLLEVHEYLLEFFGGKSALFWTMHSNIWPNYSRPATEVCNELLNSDAYEDIANLDAEWRFIEEGWIDEADDD